MDIGETAYAMVLADDLDGDGKLDLVLATMNGNVYCFRTAARAHPLRAWPSEVRRRPRRMRQLICCCSPGPTACSNL